MKTEREKMLDGELYIPLDADLVARRKKARDLLREFNSSRDEDKIRREAIIRELIGSSGVDIWIEPPFFCDYGDNITLGNRVFFNFNCVVLDCARVTVGDDVMFGPNVQIYPATHPLDHVERKSGRELGKAISIGSDVWIGGGAIVCPGVRIGSRSVIGAGSVVTRDVPEGVLAVGNPCRVMRNL